MQENCQARGTDFLNPANYGSHKANGWYNIRESTI